MKTRLIQTLYVATLVISLGGCGHSVPRLDPFRWEALQHEIDSLTLALEWNLVNDAPVDSMAALVDKFHRVSSRQDKNIRNEALARYSFWNARLMSRRGETQAARMELTKALNLNDSSRFPYLPHRVNELLDIVNNARDTSYFTTLLNNLDFYVQIKDLPREANIYTLIGNNLMAVDNGEQSLKYYKLADSIHTILGFDKYVIFNLINETAVLNSTGREEEADSILRLLRNHPDIKENDMTWHLVMRNSYVNDNDVSHLYKTYLKIRKNDSVADADCPPVQGLYEAMLASYYEGVQRYDSADHYASKAIKHIDNLREYSDVAMCHAAYSRMLARNGKHAEAYGELVKSIRYDSLEREISQPIQKAHIQNMRVIRKMDAESRQERSRMRFNYLLLLSICVFIVIGAIWTFQRKSSMAKLRHMESELEIEKNKRKLMVMSLHLKEKDEMFSIMSSNIEKLSKDGKIEAQEAKRMEHEIRLHLAGDNERETFADMFEQVNPDFIRRLKSRYPDLSESNVKLCCYILIGLNNRQIGNLLNIQPGSVKQSRWRLRSKFGLNSDASLEDFIRSILD